jgi:hypothetical protein
VPIGRWLNQHIAPSDDEQKPLLGGTRCVGGKNNRTGRKQNAKECPEEIVLHLNFGFLLGLPLS